MTDKPQTPDLTIAPIFAAHFKAGGTRKTDHAHLFIPEVSSVEKNEVFGSAPSYEETKAFLEGGWDEVEELRIEFWGGANGNH